MLQVGNRKSRQIRKIRPAEGPTFGRLDFRNAGFLIGAILEPSRQLVSLILTKNFVPSMGDHCIHGVRPMGTPFMNRLKWKIAILAVFYQMYESGVLGQKPILQNIFRSQLGHEICCLPGCPFNHV